MMEEVKYYFRLFMRRLPFMTIIMAICVSVSVVVAFRLPETYSSSATLLVEGSSIPDRMVGVDLGIAASQQLVIVQRNLMTRANLLEVARETKAFPGISRMTPDEIVTQMRESTNIARGGGRRKGSSDGMTISFESSDPKKAAAVVNQYVTIMLADSSDVRTSRAQGTLDFFEQEVQNLSENLDLQSQEIVAFKNANAQALPENLTYRLNRQSLLQERLSRSEREKEALSTQRANILRIYETTGNIQRQDQAVLSPEQQNLARLEQELNTALSVYSEANPRVRLLRSRIDTLREQIEADAVLTASAVQSDENQTRAATVLEVSLAEVDSQIESIDKDAAAVRKELEALQASIERTPTNRIVLEAMNRELENLRQLHSDTLRRLNQARMSERVESSAKGERITLLEPASVPTSPTSPNRLMIAGGGLAVGSALSVALFMLLEVLNQAIRRPADIEKKLGITPLIALPVIESPRVRRLRRLRKLAVLLGTMLVLLGVFWAIDTYYMRLERILQILLEGLL